MAERSDLEFTYSLTDRIFRLSLGELGDFSGAKYDGDFSLSLEEAQRRKHDYVAERIGIGPGRRILDLGCGWGPLLDYVRRHPLYHKRITRTSKFMAHDERNEARIGDTVRIVETRPLSARKRWRLGNIIARAE